MKIDWNKVFETGGHYTPVNNFVLDQLLSHILSLRGGEKIERAADLGCGRGKLVIKLAKRGIKTMGFDISSIALNQAKKHALEENVANMTNFVELDLENLSDWDSSTNFDLIFNKLTLVFITNKKEFFKNVKNLLNKNSIFVLMTPILKEDINYPDVKEKRISVPQKEVENLLNEVFDNFELYSSKHFDDYGVENTYIVLNK